MRLHDHIFTLTMTSSRSWFYNDHSFELSIACTHTQTLIIYSPHTLRMHHMPAPLTYHIHPGPVPELLHRYCFMLAKSRNSGSKLYIWELRLNCDHLNGVINVSQKTVGIVIEPHIG